jgi:hypothetical protein
MKTRAQSMYSLGRLAQYLGETRKPPREIQVYDFHNTVLPALPPPPEALLKITCSHHLQRCGVKAVEALACVWKVESFQKKVLFLQPG